MLSKIAPEQQLVMAFMFMFICFFKLDLLDRFSPHFFAPTSNVDARFSAMSNVYGVFLLYFRIRLKRVSPHSYEIRRAT